ncbi:MAG: hypothetical protein H7Y12_01975 [Sphingobacteriaceae bacterium]|nr:hypothetical protein [Cytophagaceae bacterium]
MKTLTLFIALFLVGISLAPESSAMGYPHRLFGSKRSVKLALVPRRTTTAPKPSIARRSVPTLRFTDWVRVLLRTE